MAMPLIISGMLLDTDLRYPIHVACGKAILLSQSMVNPEWRMG